MILQTLGSEENLIGTDDLNAYDDVLKEDKLAVGIWMNIIIMSIYQ